MADTVTDRAEFLLARIKEREDKARAASPGPWRVDDESYAEAIYDRDNNAVVAGGRWGGEARVFDTTADALHIAANDPVYVLADCAAKRKLIEAVVDKDPFDAMGAEGAYEHLILTHLAEPFRDHPDCPKELRSV